MTSKTKFDFIDFEEEKVKLWQKAYSEIKHILILKGFENQRVELHREEIVHCVKLELPDILVLEDIFGKNDYAENFEDDKLFEVYNGLILF